MQKRKDGRMMRSDFYRDVERDGQDLSKLNTVLNVNKTVYFNRLMDNGFNPFNIYLAIDYDAIYMDIVFKLVDSNPEKLTVEELQSMQAQFIGVVLKMMFGTPFSSLYFSKFAHEKACAMFALILTKV